MTLKEFRDLVFNMGQSAPFINETPIEREIKINMGEVFAYLMSCVDGRVLGKRRIDYLNNQIDSLIMNIVDYNGFNEEIHQMCCDVIKWIQSSIELFIENCEKWELFESAANFKKVYDYQFIGIGKK